jgi:ABC-2 type transport system ATP-binding protein
MSEMAIQTSHLTKRYNGTIAVRDMSLSVRRGIVFGLLGPNGAGKSSTIGVLTTLLKPSNGDALVAGHSVVSKPRDVRRSIGLVHQFSMLDRDLSVWENLDFQARLYRMSAKTRRSRIAAALHVAGLEDREYTRVEFLSGGMRRRLEIARGLLHQPTVLFLDEPTAGLDIQARRAVWDELRRLRAARAVTIVLTTHYLEEADALCDEVAIIDHGRIMAQGSPDRLKEQLGGDTVRARLTEPDPALLQNLKKISGITEVKIDGDSVTCQLERGAQRVPEIVATLQRGSKQLRSFHVQPPSLDDVFLARTGHRMKEPNAE